MKISKIFGATKKITIPTLKIVRNQKKFLTLQFKQIKRQHIMKRDENPFDGKGVYTEMAIICYDLLMKGEPVSMSDVMKKYQDHFRERNGKDPDVTIEKNGISKCYGYGELKKAFLEIRKFLKREFCDKVYRDKEGNRSSCATVRGNCIKCIFDGYVIIKGGTRDKSFKYYGKDNDPLGKFKTLKAITDLSQYARFCADSAGFFPSAWLDYFLGGSMDLFKIKQRKEKEGLSIVSSADRPLDNIDLLPELYVAIRDKRVLKMSYKRIEGEMEFHPHILKEFNGRWFLFGFDNTHEHKIRNLPLDRIIEFSEIPKAKYIPATAGCYESYFRDKIGVSTDKNRQPAEDIIFRARNYNMFNLIKTKPFHHSQKVLKEYGEYDGKKYGEFSIHVEVNNEFIGRILQMGAGLEVISPSRVRDIFKDRTKHLADLYND